jgi:hypothetical protein
MSEIFKLLVCGIDVHSFCANTVKPRFIVFVGGPEKKKRWLRENDRCGGLYKMNKNGHICLYVLTK